jgi:alpha-ketoglutarate-dependent taurine dioxygenase
MTALTVTLEDKPIGAAISGIDLTDNIPDAVFGEIKRLIAERSVVVVRNQKNLPSSVLVTFARHFGTPQVNVRAEANNKRTANRSALTMRVGIGTRTSAIWRSQAT